MKLLSWNISCTLIRAIRSNSRSRTKNSKCYPAKRKNTYMKTIDRLIAHPNTTFFRCRKIPGQSNRTKVFLALEIFTEIALLTLSSLIMTISFCRRGAKVLIADLDSNSSLNILKGLFPFRFKRGLNLFSRRRLSLCAKD